jgi:hypothetical protein
MPLVPYWELVVQHHWLATLLLLTRMLLLLAVREDR